VVVFGRVVAHKRVDLVVRAAAEVRRHRPGLSLDVVGTGDELDRVRAVVAETGLGEAVRLHGFLPDAEKSRTLSEAVLHVCASDAEGWGQVVLEAAAHGVPTLARDVPGLRDSVRPGETGWLVPEPARGSDEDLVGRLVLGIESALDEMSEPARRDRTARECREWAAGFGWDRMHAEARDVVAEALDGPA
jgi:glycosyltransferase involved in cell wall biosynthesis